MSVPTIVRGANSNTIRIGDVAFLFSYDTIVAIQVDGKWHVSENVWSTTTGKHLNLTGVARKDRMPREDFLRLLESIKVSAEVGA